MDRKAFKYLGLAAFAVIVTAALPAFARLTGTNPSNPPDALCAGASGAEACIDGNGNVIPTTTNDAALGLPSLRFSDLQVTSATLTGNMTNGGNLAVNGNTTLGSVSSNTVTMTASTMSIGTGDLTISTATSGATQILKIKASNGHVRLGSSLAAPTIGTCGGTPAISGTDISGNFTVGTQTQTGCVITFANAYAAAPNCYVGNIATGTYTTSTSAITISGGLRDGMVGFYICSGQ